MGARADIRLTWSFLSALTALWAVNPGTYKVEDEADDLMPALAQMCIKALATEVRETVPGSKQGREVPGALTLRNGGRQAITIRVVANKIVHGSPERVEVVDDDVRLYFVNNPDADQRESWTEIWFSAPAFLQVLHEILYMRPHDSPPRDQAVRSFVESLGIDRLLPSSVTGQRG